MLTTKHALLPVICLSMATNVWAQTVGAVTQVPTTLLDFFQHGSQPPEVGEVPYSPFITSTNCKMCHELQSFNGPPTAIYRNWQGSMMSQAARDPVFYAALAIANQDAAFVGDMCIRCHSPGGWLSGRSTPVDGSSLTQADRDGVACSVCHRMVDPVLRATSPAPDQAILEMIDPFPFTLPPGGGNFIIDRQDRRRGPYADPFFPPHAALESPFHKTSELCATCHDVSNPAFERQTDGTYVLLAQDLDAPHSTGDKHDMFPLERTYSEWLHSDFASVGVDMGGRFGGLISVVSTCQDCHMPDTEGAGCFLPGAPIRPDLPSHEFAGGNAWVQDIVLNLYPGDGLVVENLEAGKDAARSMLQRACTLSVSHVSDTISVRITNEGGHKLPTGYPEGRRMWINVRFYDVNMALIAEHGHYDPFSAVLTTADTKVYEAILGVDAAVSAATGIPEGASFHFAVNNVILQDNRIPPRGFTNAAYEAVQAAPVGATYADGQYWDDTEFSVPVGTDSVTVNVYYQTASKEFIDFLKNENQTNDAGDVLHAQWALTGKSPPVWMATKTLVLDPMLFGDFDGDASVDLSDHNEQETCQTGPGGVMPNPDCDAFDSDGDGDVDLRDFADFMISFTGC